MKNIFQRMVVMLFVLLCSGVAAQEKQPKVVTKEFEVSGVCGMCEKRIEKAALMKGVKFADWNKQTQMLKVIYKTQKIEELDIHKAVAKVGHDTQKVKADDVVYNSLPACCAYRDGVETH